MIPATLLKKVITHGLGFFLGIGAAMFFAAPSHQEPSPSSPSLDDRPRQPARKVVSDRLSSPSAFHAAYSDLIERPMTRSERSECMKVLWRQWRDSDPDSMMAFLENKRVWPESCKYGGLDFPNRPDLALEFALRYGSSTVLQQLFQGDLLTNARLLAALPDEQKGKDILSVEKEIQLRLGKIGAEVVVGSPAYLRGVAEALLEEGRIDEFFEAFGQIEDPLEKEELAEEFGEMLAEEKPGEKVLAQLLHLPEPFREQAAYKLMGQGENFAMEFSGVREEHRRWIERVAGEGFVEAAAYGVSDLFRDEDAGKRGKEWAAWIARFPEGDSWQPITEAIFRGWANTGREAMVRQICALPAGPTRDLMAHEAASATIGNLAQPFDENEQKIFDSLANLQPDPEARRRFEKRFTPSDPFGNGNAGELSGDPFAEDDDPFSDSNE